MVYSLYVGWLFFRFHQWAIGQSVFYAPRPPSVEAFLPISALVALKRLILTGLYDSIHPAGLTIFLAILAISVLFRKGFCGWICPVGFASNLLEKIGFKLKTQFVLPELLDYLLHSFKYLLLFFFAYLIVLKMDLSAIEAFLRSPYNITVDARMLYFFLSPGSLATAILTFLFLVSFIIKNFWCRYICPYGALLGIFSYFSPVAIQRDPDKCIDCHQCDRMCPVMLPVSMKKGLVRSPECIGCLDCVSVCPQDDCLNVRFGALKKLPVFMLPLLIVSTFLLFWIVADKTGHWHNSLPIEVVHKYYTLGIGHQ